MEEGLDVDDLDAAMTLVLMKQDDINSLEAAALAILNLNKRDFPDEILEKAYENTTLEAVIQNANLFEHYGIIPEIEVVDEMRGGVKRPRPSLIGDVASADPADPVAAAEANAAMLARSAVSSADPADPVAAAEANAAMLARTVSSPPTESSRVPRTRTPSKKAAEAAASPFLSLAEQKRQAKLLQEAAKAERSAQLSEIGATKQFVGQTYADLRPYLKGLDVCRPKMASEFMRALFPEAAVSIWTEVLKKNCRDIYEPTAVEAQCLNTIGEVKNTDKCYICGFDFDPRTEGLQATCEHILPIIQAIFFLDLYRGSEKGKHTTAQMDILRKEYSWAHRCCNYVKADNSFLVTKLNRATGFPRWDFGMNQTTKILSTIHTTRKFEGTATVQALIATKGYDIWLKERLDIIEKQKINDIVAYIDSKGMGGTVIMIGFGNCVDSTKMNNDFKEILQKIENGEDLSDFRPQKRGRAKTMGGKTFRRRNNGKLSTGRKRRSKKSSS
jgi:hypothetical protein